MVIKFLLTQQSLQSDNLLRESGDVVVTGSVIWSVETDSCCWHWQVNRVQTCNLHHSEAHRDQIASSMCPGVVHTCSQSCPRVIGYLMMDVDSRSAQVLRGGVEDRKQEAVWDRQKKKKKKHEVILRESQRDAVKENNKRIEKKEKQMTDWAVKRH